MSLFDNGAEAPLVGVLTPVHDTAKYLAEAIESVLAQTYRRWEYIIVDNASTDGSLEIARSYAERDPRIRVYAHDELVGVLQSLNRTMRHLPAEADYCKVLCADDWLFPECLERMVATAEAHPSVGIVGAYRLDENRVNLDGIRIGRTVVPGRELGHDSLVGGFPFVFGSPTSTMIRADLVRSRPRFYNEANIHSDVEACYDLLRTCDFGFVHQVLTFTRRHNESHTSYARRLHTFLPAQIGVLVRYGPDYLTPDEYERRVAVMVFFYVRWLACHPLRLRDPEARAFHSSALEAIFAGVSRAQLGRGVARQVGRLARRASQVLSSGPVDPQSSSASKSTSPAGPSQR
jgi:glycosyltransferase involved in cell wall biosynthesis